MGARNRRWQGFHLYEYSYRMGSVLWLKANHLCCGLSCGLETQGAISRHFRLVRGNWSVTSCSLFSSGACRIMPSRSTASAVVFFEIALAYETNAYRTLYLQCNSGQRSMFCTRSRRSQSQVSKRPRKDIDLIKRRYKEAKELAK